MDAEHVIVFQFNYTAKETRALLSFGADVGLGACEALSVVDADALTDCGVEIVEHDLTIG